jgi:hypothetical protein
MPYWQIKRAEGGVVAGVSVGRRSGRRKRLLGQRLVLAPQLAGHLDVGTFALSSRSITAEAGAIARRPMRQRAQTGASLSTPMRRIEIAFSGHVASLQRIVDHGRNREMESVRDTVFTQSLSVARYLAHFITFDRRNQAVAAKLKCQH